jgi:hypothetical protein
MIRGYVMSCAYCNEEYPCRCVEPAEPVPCPICGQAEGYTVVKGKIYCTACTEKLAAHAHAVWARWMRYMLGRASRDWDRYGNDAILQEEDVAWWARQMNTSYNNLPENEKKLDREIAREYLALLKKDTTEEG